MKTLEVDVMLYRSDAPGETQITVKIPVDEAAKGRLLLSQTRGVTTCYEHTALCNLAVAIGQLNHMYGVPLRVREANDG